MAVNCFIKFETPAITGEAQDHAHKDDVQVLSWTHSFHQPTSPTRTSAGSGTVEKAHHKDFKFTKYTDKASDDLLKYCWNGKQIGKATVSSYRSDGDTDRIKYLEIIMEKCVISDISIGGGSGDTPVEKISINYGKITYKYNPQKGDDGKAAGVEPVTHDLVTDTVS